MAGVFAHVRRSGNANPDKPEVIEKYAKHPHIAGTQLAYSWEELEPEQGGYRWDMVERDMAIWVENGKKVWIEVSTANKRDIGKKSKKGPPDWIFEEGVPKVGTKKTAPYPVFWDERYLELWTGFIQRFAVEYNGHTSIEFISTGGYSGGSEPSLSSDDNEKLMRQWKKAGFDGFTEDGVYLNDAIKPILTAFSDAFTTTPVAQVIHVKTDFDDAMNLFAADLGFIALSNGFGYAKFLDGKERAIWSERRNQFAAGTGYAEWGPQGRSISAKKRDNNPRNKAKLLDCYRVAIGSDSDPELNPASRLSYLPLSERVSEIETQEEWDEAIKFASEKLT